MVKGKGMRNANPGSQKSTRKINRMVDDSKTKLKIKWNLLLIGICGSQFKKKVKVLDEEKPKI